MLQACGLAKRFGANVAVDGVDLEIRKSSCFGLLGPNGAGKTTTIGMLVGVLTPDQGQVLLDGKPMRVGDAAFKRRIGYVPQEIALYEDLNAGDNLRFFGSLYGLAGDALAKASDRVLEVAGLGDRVKEPVRNFSGGMKRRLNIAVALLHDPEFLVLDEPTVGVDPQSRNAIFDALEVLRGGGKTLLYTTHYMEEVERLCDAIAIMDHGKVIADGTMAELERMVPAQRRLSLEIESDPSAVDDAIPELCRVPGVSDATFAAPNLTMSVATLDESLPGILATLTARGIRFGALSSDRVSLEEVFLQLTGRRLRD